MQIFNRTCVPTLTNGSSVYHTTTKFKQLTINTVWN